MKNVLLLVLGLWMASVAKQSAHAQSTWNGVTTGNWNTLANWSSGGIPVSGTGTQLVFNSSGTSSYTSTNDIGAGTFTLNRITVNNTGTGTVTIAGSASTNTLTFAGTTPTLDITGNTLFLGRMAGAAVVIKTGTGTFIHDSDNTGFTGTITINQGTFMNRATSVATTNFNPTSIVVNNGGTYQFGENGAGDPNLPNSTYITVNSGGNVIWQEGETFGGFNLQGGTIDLQLGSTNSQGGTAQSWTSGTLTGTGVSAQSVGSTTAINKTTTGTVNVTGNAAINTTTGGLNIQEGKIAMAAAGNLGTAPITLGAAATTGTFEYQGATASRAGTFGINAGGGVIGVTTSTATLTLSGNLSGAGNLSKTGAGALHLTGTLGGTGTTTASEGILRVNPVTASGAFAIAGGGTLATNSGTGSASFTTPSLNFAASTATLQFELNTAAVTTAPLVNVTSTNALTFTGTPTLKLTNTQPFANGTYTLLDYSGTGISSGFALSLPGRTIGSLVYDTVGTKIDLSVTGIDSVKWTGGINNTWDVGSAIGVGGTNNWQLVIAGTATNFINTDTALFDDTASTFAVNLTSTVLPSATTVNAATDYTFSGAGKLSGTGTLTKSGTGTLTISTTNDFSGTTTVNGGTISIDTEDRLGVTADITLNGGTLATTASFAIDDTGRNISLGASNGTINVAASTALTLSNGLLGAGTLTKEGTGTLVLAGEQGSHTGNFIINAGTLQSGPADLNFIGGTSSVTINSGGTLDLNGFNEGFGSLIGSGTVTNNSAATTARLGPSPTANTTFDGLIVDGAGQVALDKGGNFNLKLTNANNNFSGTQTLGDRAIPVTIALASGGIEFTSNGALGVVGGDFYLDGGDAAVDKLIFGADNITLDAGRQLNINNFTGIDTQGFTATIAGAILGDDNNGSLIGSNDSFRKQGTGTLRLTGTTDQIDEVFVDAGTLQVFTTLSTAATTVASGAKLQGSGTLNGITTIQSGGVVEAGTASTTGVLTFTAATMSDGSRADFHLTSNGVNDRLSVTSNNGFRVGTTSTSTAAFKIILDYTAQFGDLFNLLDWTGLINGDTNLADNLDFSSATLTGGLTWDTSAFHSTGVISVAGMVPEPSRILLLTFGLGALLLRRQRR